MLLLPLSAGVLSVRRFTTSLPLLANMDHGLAFSKMKRGEIDCRLQGGGGAAGGATGGQGGSSWNALDFIFFLFSPVDKGTRTSQGINDKEILGYQDALLS